MSFKIKANVLEKYSGKEESHIIIPDGVVRIADYAFSNHEEITGVTVPDSVRNIGCSAFNNCKNISTVSTTSLKKWLSIQFGIFDANPLRLGAALVVNGETVSDLMIPDGIKKIGDHAFEGCTSIVNVVVPEGVTEIGGEAFSGCPNLKSVKLPDTISIIHDYAFSQCPNLQTIVVDAQLTKIGIQFKTPISQTLELKAKELALWGNPSKGFYSLKARTKIPVEIIPMVNKFTDEEIASVLLYQSTKAWKQWADKRIKNPSKICSGIFDIMEEDPLAPAASLADFLNSYAGKLTDDQLKKAVSILESKKYKKMKDITCIPSSVRAQSGTLSKENPVETRVRDLCEKRPVPDEVLDVVKKGIPYAHSKEVSSRMAVAFILSEYAKEWDRCSGPVLFQRYGTSAEGIPDGTKLNVCPEADEVAEALDQKSLRVFLGSLISGGRYRRWLLAWARFATDEVVESWTHNYKTDIKGKAKDYYFTYSMRECLLINDTRAAMQFFDRIDDLDRYAKKHGKTAMELRDSVMLPDFGFDERGIRTFDTGDSIIEVSLTPDLGLKLFNTKTQKEIRSFPKDGENKRKLNAATAQFNEFKESVLGFAKARTELIHKMHISGEYISLESWKNIYLNHLVIRHLTELLVWQDQNENTFMVDDGKIMDAQGNTYDPEGNVRVAHVLCMKEADIKAWQQKLAGTGKKQLFDQVWEPVVEWDQKTVSTRYTGAVITYQERNALKKALKLRGIDSGSDDMAFEYHHRAGSFRFSNEGTLNIGKCLRIGYHTDPDKKEVTFKNTSIGYLDEIREINADLFELDKIVITSHIAKDNDTVLTEAILSAFTVSQINAFLNLAIKSKAAKSTAVLLEYKNKHYPEFAEVNEFSLDW